MIQIQKEHLAAACKHLLRVVPKKPTLPILGCIRIHQTPQSIHLTSTAIDRVIHITIPSLSLGGIKSKIAALRAKREGAFFIPADLLASAADGADAGSFVTLERANIRIILNEQPSNIPVEGYGDAEWPDQIAGAAFTPVAGTFDPDATKRLMRCASKDEGRYVLMSIHWDAEGILIATDGRRLQREPFTPLTQSIGNPQGANDPSDTFKGITIPLEACKLIPARASIALASGYIAFTATENILTIRIFAKLMDGNYPNWRQVTPQPSGKSVRFDNERAAESLRKINKIGSGKKMDSTRIEVAKHSGNYGTITLTPRKDGKPCGSFALPAIVEGSPDAIHFSTQFLIDALENGGDTIDYADGMSPALITGAKGNTHILMPMRDGGTTTQPEPEPEPEPEEIEEMEEVEV
jgi:DNA polymerase-3 subunit beta